MPLKEKDFTTSDALSSRGSCSPAAAHISDTIDGTCLSLREVIEVARWYNLHTDLGKANPFVIPKQQSLVKDRHSRDRLLEEVHERLNTRRGEEDQWERIVPSNTIAGKRLRAAFRPVMPKSWIANDRTWLSNFDIEAVMKQYEDVDPTFWMVGVFPMDFAHKLEDGECVSMEMCGLSVKKMRAAGKTHAGIVLNLDKHYESGSHWVALYVNIDPIYPNYGVFYYDSVADDTPKEVKSFAKSLCDEMKMLEKQNKNSSVKKRPFRFAQNIYRRQFKNTECGVFTMFFIVCCMSRELQFDYICRCMGNDENLHTLRSVFFRRPPSSVSSLT